MPQKETPFTTDSSHLTKMKTLTFALMGSVALNVGLLAALSFSWFYEPLPTLPKTLSSAAKGEEGNCHKMLQAMEKLSFRELVALLTNRELVEEGFVKRDLALATLVASHSFHLDKALSSKPIQRRRFPLEQGGEIELFPALEEADFEAILRFAYQEKWPLTSRGLFALLQKGGKDESLKQTFLLTPEFYAVDLLFQKSGSVQPADSLLALISEGNFELLERFAKEQSEGLDLSLERRRELLLSYLTLRSPTAAALLLKTDFSFALKRLDDRALLSLLALLPEKGPQEAPFCLELLKSPRSDAIWRASAERLYRSRGEPVPAKIDPKEVLAHFGGRKILAPPPPSPEKQLHLVKEGESLWKIAKLYQVKVDEVVKLNGIDPSKIYPGMTLEIPHKIQGTGSEPPR